MPDARKPLSPYRCPNVDASVPNEVALFCNYTDCRPCSEQRASMLAEHSSVEDEWAMDQVAHDVEAAAGYAGHVGNLGIFGEG